VLLSVSIPITAMTLNLTLEEEMKERGPNFSVKTVKEPITQLTSVTSCTDIPAADKEQETKISEQPIVLGENSPVKVITMRLLLPRLDLVKSNLSN